MLVMLSETRAGEASWMHLSMQAISALWLINLMEWIDSVLSENLKLGCDTKI